MEEIIPDLKYYFMQYEKYFDDSSAHFSKVNYCDLNEFPEAIRGSVIIYLLESFRELEGKKLLVIDECWSLLESNAEYISECFRTFRKC